MKTNTNLTTKQWKLYDFIKDKTTEKGYTTIEEIAIAFPDYSFNPKECNKTNAPEIYEDIDAINLSPKIEKWIIKNRNHIKLATKEEAEREFIALGKKLSKTNKFRYRLKLKMKSNNQYKALSEDNKPIQESKGREVFEAYVK